MSGGAPRAGAQGAGAETAVSGAATHLIVIAGAGGEPAYTESFTSAAMSMVDAARRLGVPETHVVCLVEDPARGGAGCAERSAREGVERAIAGVADRARAGDRVVILLVGHGSGTGAESRFNLPGRDLTAADFARLLDRFGTRQVALVNAASASGDFIPVLSGANRVVITATKTGFERNETMFGRHFVAAFAESGADVDKDGRTSLLEAFDYARREVARAYERENRILTEHALLDDDGDGKGSPAPGGREGDGAIARRIALGGGAAAAVAARAASDPRLVGLVARRDSLEARVEALRGRKARMDSTAYARELERLLVELAMTNRELRAADAGGRGGRP
jgi:hypothetical protein